MAEWKPRRMQKASKYKDGDWKRKSSPTRGEYLEMGDEVVIVNRGGNQMKVIKTLALNIPPIVIGHLDDKGIDLLDGMLGGNETMDEVVEFFEEYKPAGPLKLRLKRRGVDGEEEEYSADEDEEIEEDDNEEETDEETIAEEESVPQDTSEGEGKKKKKKESKKSKEKKEKKESKDSEEGEEKYGVDDYKKIPYMHPETRTCSFNDFFVEVEKVAVKKELVEEQTLDVMEIKMGGSYRTDIVDLRSQKQNREEIEKHFIKIDAREQQERENRLKLEELKRRTKEVNMTRSSVRNVWGIDMSYNNSPDEGFLLSIVNVEAETPASKSGLSSGDAIVSVNGWAITCMDKVEVVLHILQACGNHTTLGIMRENEENRNWTHIGIY